MDNIPYTVVINLPEDSNKAFRVPNEVFQAALLKYYGPKRVEVCSKP